MTKEEINQKTSLCFLLNPNCNITTYILKQNAELKAFKQDCIKLTEDNVVMAKQRGETVIQLTKAKEIIKKFLEFVNNEVEFEPEHPQEHTDLWNELCEKAEQFIREEENDRNRN